MAAVRLAYFLTAHQYPDQVARLIKRIETEADVCALSAFNVRTREEAGTWRSIVAAHSDFIPRIRSSSHNVWGSFQQVTENLDAMEWALKTGFEYFINLSAQCYPLWPPEHIKEVLEATGKSCIEVSTCPLDREGQVAGVAGRSLRDVLRWRGFPMDAHRFTDWWFRPLFVGRRRVMVRVPNIRRMLPLGLQPCYGSGWFCLARPHVRAVVDYVRAHPEVSSFFRHNGVPIENFFNTLIWNVVPPDEVSRRNLRYESWSGQGAHIHSFTTKDVGSLLTSEALWARKFDQSLDRVPLDEIDRKRFGISKRAYS